MIGVGRDNDYGHPAPSLLAALIAAGTTDVLRTDEDGDVAVVLRDGVLSTVRRGVLSVREPTR
jgi:competence protein ComEC